MPTRHLYLTRHGAADAFGELTADGRRQAALLGERLAHLPIDAVWHSPLPRARESALELARRLAARTPVAEVPELVDHVPYVPPLAELPAAWVPFFDGYDSEKTASGLRTAQSLVARFATAPSGPADTHEVLVTHAYAIAWLVRDALDAPPARWLGLESANTGLTVLQYRPMQPAALVMFNDLTHLPPELRWTGFPATTLP